MTWSNRQKQSAFVLILVILGIGYMSLKSNPDSPEAAIETAIDAMIEGAEAKDIDPFEDHVSPSFRDESNRPKDDVLRIVRAIFLRHPTIAISKVNLDITSTTNPAVYDARLLVLTGEGLLPKDKAEFYLTFRQEQGRWLLWQAQWGDGYGY